MKLSTKFSARSKDGRIVLKLRHEVPAPVIVESALITVEGGGMDDDVHPFDISINGNVVFSGRGRIGQTFSFQPPFFIPGGVVAVNVTAYRVQNDLAAVGALILSIASK